MSGMGFGGMDAARMSAIQMQAEIDRLRALLKEAFDSLLECDERHEANHHDTCCGNCDAAVPLPHSLCCRIKSAIHEGKKP